MIESLKRFFERGSMGGDLMLVAGVGIFAIFFALGSAKLWDRDEPRNARCAKEMMDRADWIVPTFNGQLRTHKPALTYWVMISAYRVFGVNEFAARFGSAAFGVGTLLCTYLMGRRLADRQTGIAAALLLSCAVMFQVASRAATPDGPLIFCVSAALTCFVYAATKSTDSPDGVRGLTLATPTRWWMFGVYALLGLAVLAKGPVGLVLPVCVMLGFLTLAPWYQTMPPAALASWRERGTSLVANFSTAMLSLRPLMGLVIVLAIAGPWYAAVGFATEGEFLRGFFYEHNLRRATEAMEGHRGNFLFYPLAIMIGFFPGSIFTLPTVAEAASDLRRTTPTSLASLWGGLWIAAFVGAFSLAGTKLPSYVTPCYPAVALLVGITALRWARGETNSRVWGVTSGVILAVIGLVAAAVLFRELSIRLPEKTHLIAAVTPLILGGAVAAILAAKGLPSRALGTIVAAGILFAVATWGWGAGQFNDARDVSAVLDPIAHDSTEKSTLAIRSLEASYVFYSDRHFVEIGALADEPRYREQLLQGDFSRVLLREQDVALMPDSFQNLYRPVAKVKLFLKTDFLALYERIDDVAHQLDNSRK